MMQSLVPTLAGFGPLGTPELIILAILLGIVVGGALLLIWIVKKLSGKK